MLASDMKAFRLWAFNVNNYISQSAESEGRDGSVAFMPQLHRCGIVAARGLFGLCKILQCEHQKRAAGARAGRFVGMLDRMFANPESSTPIQIS